VIGVRTWELNVSAGCRARPVRPRPPPTKRCGSDSVGAVIRPVVPSPSHYFSARFTTTSSEPGCSAYGKTLASRPSFGHPSRRSTLMTACPSSAPPSAGPSSRIVPTPWPSGNRRVRRIAQVTRMTRAFIGRVVHDRHRVVWLVTPAPSSGSGPSPYKSTHSAPFLSQSIVPR